MSQSNHENESDLIVLNNISPGAPWQPRCFQLDRANGAIKSIWRRQSAVAAPHGFGSYVLAASGLGSTRHFIAVYMSREGWRCFSGGREYDLGATSVEWRRGSGSLGGLGVAKLKLLSGKSSVEIVYFRPWLRHWFEGGWSLDDTDIGWTVARIASDGSSRLRLAKALGIEPEPSAVR